MVSSCIKQLCAMSYQGSETSHTQCGLSYKKPGTKTSECPTFDIRGYCDALFCIKVKTVILNWVFSVSKWASCAI